MAKIVLATFGSLGDLHPKIALGLELKRRGHNVSIAAMAFYREKIESLGLGFTMMAPHMDPQVEGRSPELMNPRTGSEKIIRDIIFGNLRAMYRDLVVATDGADLLITGELIYAADAIAETTDVRWISTSLSPISFFSMHDPPVPPTAQWMKHLRPLGKTFHSAVFEIARRGIADWYEPYREFRGELGLDIDHDPIFRDKFSKLLHLAMYSKVLGKPQPDWPRATLQTGFCFYDGALDLGGMGRELQEFINAGEPPLVFTLGSAAVMDAGDFFEVSAAAALLLGRRAVLLYGIFNEPPEMLGEDIAAFDYAPFAELFPQAACIIHQGGVGTTGQALRAGVPQLIMPYAHDQPDNAERCRRAGLAETITRERYTPDAAARSIEKLIADKTYKAKAFQASRIVASERGTVTACDAIEDILKMPFRRLK